MSDLERRVIELEELVARIPVRWPTMPAQRTSGWAKLTEDLLPGDTATATPDGYKKEITITDGKSLLAAGKKIPSGAYVFYAEDFQGQYQLVQSACPVDQ